MDEKAIGNLIALILLIMIINFVIGASNLLELKSYSEECYETKEVVSHEIMYPLVCDFKCDIPQMFPHYSDENGSWMNVSWINNSCGEEYLVNCSLEKSNPYIFEYTTTICTKNILTKKLREEKQ